MKKCINGIMQEMTAEEIKEQNEVVEIIPDDKPSLEERLEKFEKLLKELGGISL